MPTQRQLRVNNLLQQEIASILRREITDPHVGFVTITDVRVTGDLQNASIFYTVLGDEEARTGSAAALESANQRVLDATVHTMLSDDPWEWRAVWMAGLGANSPGSCPYTALNEDSVTLQAYQPVVITGQMYDTANDPNLYAPPVLRVRRRDADDDADLPVAVVSDSMQTNTIGRVYTVGVCLCYLTGDDAVRASYDTVDGTALTLTSEGSIEVVWCNDDSAKPGLIRLGGGGGGGGSSRCWIEVSRKSELPSAPYPDGLLFAFVSGWDSVYERNIAGELPAVYALVRRYDAAPDYWACITHTQEYV